MPGKGNFEVVGDTQVRTETIVREGNLGKDTDGVMQWEHVTPAKALFEFAGVSPTDMLKLAAQQVSILTRKLIAELGGGDEIATIDVAQLLEERASRRGTGAGTAVFKFTAAMEAHAGIMGLEFDAVDERAEVDGKNRLTEAANTQRKALRAMEKVWAEPAEGFWAHLVKKLGAKGVKVPFKKGDMLREYNTLGESVHGVSVRAEKLRTINTVFVGAGAVEDL